jgi:peroxiredoxin
MFIRRLILLLGALLLIGCGTASAPTTPTAGEPAPPLALPTLDGEIVALDSLRGNVVLVNFWASWCEPCTREMPLFQQWHEQYEAEGLRILGVDTLHQDQLAAVEAFIQEREITYPILLDEEGDTSRQWLIRGLPRTYVVDREGIVRALHIGEFEQSDFEQQVLPLLEQQASTP